MQKIVELMKKYRWLCAAGAVLAVFLLLAGWKLSFAAADFHRAKQQLQAINDRLNQLNNRVPYPSPANVQREQENLQELTDAYNELAERLYAGQVAPKRMEAAEFMPLLENTLRRLRTGFRANHVELPAKFDFGFEKYAGGQMPAPQDIPRLVQQLQIIEKLCEAVVEARVAALQGIVREEFDAAAAAPGRRAETAPPSDQPETPPLFTVQRFALTLQGSEPALLALLNLLNRMPMFAVVSAVDVKNRRPTLKEDAASGKASTNAPALDPKDRPVVIGREELTARIDVEVYQFAPPLPWRPTS